MIALEPNEQYVREAWDKLSKTNSIWCGLEGSSYENFLMSCMSSALLIDFGFGMGRITALTPGHCCRVHGVFWSKEFARNKGDIVFALANVATMLKVRRIECVIPTGVRSLERLVKGLGFSFEGRMKSFYKTTSRFIDGDLYAIIC